MSIYYTKDHEWIKIEEDVLLIGITPYAQEQLGDIVYVDLPDIGKEVFEGELVVVIESVKAAGEIKSPVDGEVAEANLALSDKPELVNTDPNGEGWLVRVAPKETPDTDQWMSAEDYEKFVGGLE